MNGIETICRNVSGAAAKVADDYLMHEVGKKLGSNVGVADLRDLANQQRLQIHRYEHSKLNKAYLDDCLIAVWHDPEVNIDGLEMRLTFRCGDPNFKSFLAQPHENTPPHLMAD